MKNLSHKINRRRNALLHFLKMWHKTGKVSVLGKSPIWGGVRLRSSDRHGPKKTYILGKKHFRDPHINTPIWSSFKKCRKIKGTTFLFLIFSLMHLKNAQNNGPKFKTAWTYIAKWTASYILTWIMLMFENITISHKKSLISIFIWPQCHYKWQFGLLI